MGWPVGVIAVCGWMHQPMRPMGFVTASLTGSRPWRMSKRLHGSFALRRISKRLTWLAFLSLRSCSGLRLALHAARQIANHDHCVGWITSARPAEIGCPELEIMAITGHQTPKTSRVTPRPIVKISWPQAHIAIGGTIKPETRTSRFLLSCQKRLQS